MKSSSSHENLLHLWRLPGLLIAVGFIVVLTACSDATADNATVNGFAGNCTPSIDVDPDSATDSEVAELNQAAEEFLTSLSPEQLSKVSSCLGDSEMYSWTNVPGRRSGGIRLGELSAEQQTLARAAVYAFLSDAGRTKASVISTKIEELSGAGPIEDYTVAVFSRPDEPNVWGLQFDGHHLALNFLVQNDSAILAPAFVGTNPRSADGYAPLGVETESGRLMFSSLTEEQQEQALVPGLVQGDVQVGSGGGQVDRGRKFDYSAFNDIGLPVSSLSVEQMNVLRGLIGEYVGNLRKPFSSRVMEDIEASLQSGFFVFSTRGSRMYYRVFVADTLLIEYDDVSAEHVHTVTRLLGNDKMSDYGEFAYDSTRSPTLQRHYRMEHTHEEPTEGLIAHVH